MSKQKKRRGRKKRSPSADDLPWFDRDLGTQLFLWRCRPHYRPLLLTGNANGYKYRTQIAAWTESLSNARFPAWGGQRLAGGDAELWLIGDWLGAE